MPPVKHKKTPSPVRLTATSGPSPAASSTPSSAIELADQLHSTAIHLLRRLRTGDRLSGIGPAQLSALSVLVFGGPKSLGELAHAEQVRPPTMSRIVGGLERLKLIRRHRTDDGRRIKLEATEKGVALMWEGRKRRVESLAKALEALGEKERQEIQQVIPLLRQILGTL